MGALVKDRSERGVLEYVCEREVEVYIMCQSGF